MKAYRIVNRGDNRSLADFRNGNQMWAVEVMDGEVWRAGDTKLQCEVAIKKLPEEFAKNADRLPPSIFVAAPWPDWYDAATT